MALTAGTRLGSYEILAPLGAGVQGEVYRARDTKLERDVAIKVLPEEFANDHERLARFEREAKLLASLNHPNIASIYGLEDSDGVKALVLELVEGPTLAERIQQGPIPVEEALPIARQIAEALEAGHEAGVIHRDLKPANVKVREDGTVKVLDYGLAKALGGDAPRGTDTDLSQSPTLTRQGTKVGVILGTAAYMSPEQAKGQVVDKRSDIFAFGSVLYEMLAGRQAFAGATVSDMLAAILKAEPDWKLLPSTVEPEIRRLLRRCLEKDRRERQRDIGDVRLEIQEILAEPAGERVEVAAGFPKPMGWRRIAPFVVASSLVVGALVGLAVWNLRPSPRRPLTRFGITLPADVVTSFGENRVLALSPDGRSLVYAANGQLYLQALDQMKPAPIRGTEAGIGSPFHASRAPFFSPDGLWLGFRASGKLRKVSVTGGAPVTLCDAGYMYDANWGPDDTIVFGEGARGVFRVSANGGTPEVLIPMESSKGEMAYGPQILPDGKAVLFTLAIRGDWNQALVWRNSASLETALSSLCLRGSKTSVSCG